MVACFWRGKMGPFRRHYTGRRDFATLVIDMDRACIEKISKALADQTRLKIFEAISARTEMNCGEIVAMRGVTPATVSHNLVPGYLLLSLAFPSQITLL